jgi:hypothetical protein
MRIKKLIIAALFVVVCSLSASAQFRIGPRLGVAVSDLHFNKSVFDTDNRAGFTGGIMTEFTVPVIGLGFDASVMYVRRNTEWLAEQGLEKNNRDYIDIPVNLKWKISIPLISKIVSPYIATGPDFAFLTSRRAVSDAFDNKSFDFSWNLGFGLQFLSHLQIGASYGFGFNKAVEIIKNNDYKNIDLEGKNRYWTVTAAYLF